MAMALMAVFLINVQSVSAAPYFGGVSKLQAHVYLTSSDGKAKDVKVSVDYKGVVKEKTVNVPRNALKEVEFVFPPIEMGWFDTFTACAENTHTGELNCKSAVYYFNRAQAQNIYLDVYNTK